MHRLVQICAHMVVFNDQVENLFTFHSIPDFSPLKPFKLFFSIRKDEKCLFLWFIDDTYYFVHIVSRFFCVLQHAIKWLNVKIH